MKKSNSKVMETGLTTSSSPLQELAEKGQDGIPGMLEFIKRKIAEITKGTKEEESTKGKRLPGFDEISKVDKVSTLVQAHSSVVGKARAYADSAKALGVNTSKFPFKLEGCSETQWVEDIQRRVVVLSNEKELAKLKETQRILEDNLSQEAKLKNDLEKISQQYADDLPLE